MKRMKGESGNVFTVLLGGIVLSGALSMALYQMMGGPAMSSLTLAHRTAAQSQAQIVARMVIADAVGQTANTESGVAGDCDTDNFVEPRPFRAVAGWTATQNFVHPANGGNIPLAIGGSATDPWNTDYGYCVWDVGPFNDPAIDRTDITASYIHSLTETVSAQIGYGFSHRVEDPEDATSNRVFLILGKTFETGL